MAKTNTATPALSIADLTIDQILALSPAEREAMLGVAPAVESTSTVVEDLAAYAGAGAAYVVNAFSGAPSAFALAFQANRRR